MTHDDRTAGATYPVSAEAAGEVAAACRLHARSADDLGEGWGDYPVLGQMFSARGRLWRLVAEEVGRTGSIDALLGHATVGGDS